MKKILSVLFLAAGVLMAQEKQTVNFPQPDKTGGKPLMQALNERKTTRDFKENAPISDKQLGDLLWATSGYNRPGMRTAPSAMNRQSLELYVVRKDGVWLYDAKNHTITKVMDGDKREATGSQGFVATAALNLVFVANTHRTPDQNAMEWAKMDACFNAQNTYLYCASANLGCVVRGAFSAEKISKELDLPSYHKPVLAMTVGIPKN